MVALVPPATEQPSFDATVFAGGGCRCFWQAGFWKVAAPELALQPVTVAGVSAGAAFACAALTGTIDRVLDDFKRRVSRNVRNVHLRNALRTEPIFPHERIYRACIESNIDDETLSRLQRGPDLRVLLARPPAWLRGRAAVAAAAAAHVLNRRDLFVHARWGDRFGFRREVVSARDCPSTAELIELVLHSSCTPPILPVYRRGGRVVLDGGLLDNAPAEIVEPAHSTLVLLTRHYPESELPRVPGRTYVAPSEPVPIVEWDYTSPELVQKTYDLGRRDGEAFVRARQAAA